MSVADEDDAEGDPYETYRRFKQSFTNAGYSASHLARTLNQKRLDALNNLN